MNGIKNFLKEMFSMQEKRISTLIICLLACMSLAFWMYVAREDIPETLLIIIQTLIYVVAGVNGVNVITKMFNSNYENKNNEYLERSDYNG